MYAIRGAVNAAENNKEEILSATKELMTSIIKANKLQEKDLISIITTATDDLDQVYPGQAIRELGFDLTPILCMQEMKVENSSSKMIRLLIHAAGNKEKKKIKHQYLKKAKNLRPDLVDN